MIMWENEVDFADDFIEQKGRIICFVSGIEFKVDRVTVEILVMNSWWDSRTRTL